MRAARHACFGVAGAANRRLADGALGAAAFAVYGGNDRFFTCSVDGHAVQRDAEYRDGLRGGRAGSGADLRNYSPEGTREDQGSFRQAKKTIYLSLALFGFFLGIAVLAKGPAALILAGGAILLWAALTKRWREALRLFHPIAIATFFLTCLPWYVLCARRNPEFFRVFIIEHNFKRYLTPEFQHIQPFWYYLPITIMALLPWLFWLAWFAFREGQANQKASTNGRKYSFWRRGVCFPFCFFPYRNRNCPATFFRRYFRWAF